MTNPLIGRCSSCKYARTFEQLQATRQYCQRNPPTPLLIPTDRGPVLFGIWPPVDNDLTCGEWRAVALLERGAFSELRRGGGDAEAT
jgi:hypothetical protein